MKIMEQGYAIGKAANQPPKTPEKKPNKKNKNRNKNKNAQGNENQQINKRFDTSLKPSESRFTQFFSNLIAGRASAGSGNSSSAVSVMFGGEPRRNAKGKIDEETILQYLSDLSQLKLQGCQCNFEVIGSEYVASVVCQNSTFAKSLIARINEGTEFTMIRALPKTHDEVKVKQILEGFMQKCEKPFKRHHEKMLECKYQINELSRPYGRNGEMPFSEWERRKDLRKPLESKLEELGGQQLEFERFIAKLKLKLEEFFGSANFESKSTEIRKEFALELARYEGGLPMYARKSDVIEVVQNNQVSVILGETGSGKSTQMLQYMHEAGLHEKGVIVCTQPRKVAAISLSQRVAQEMGSTVGGLVGYQVGMQAKKSPNTRLLYVTDHVLLNECLKDRAFRQFSCIIIDEAHERSIYTDLLLGLVKRILPVRPDLKVIITSATINPEVFVRFFTSKTESERKPQVLSVSGRMFPVEVMYDKEENEDYVGAAWQKAFEIHREAPQGDILVFLTSPLETERARKSLKNVVDNKAIVLELHGRLQVADQQKVFEPTPEGHRKIVFATNSAETSITIPGIKYVVDCGRVREMTYDASRNMSALIVTWTTKSSAEQRKGRAGRTAAGCCYRLYTADQFEAMRPESVPEILRIHVGQALLKLMSLGIADPTDFDFVEPPSQHAIDSAVEVLRDLEALDDNGITEVGKRLAKLSLEPRIGKVALLGIDRQVAYESLIMAAVMSVGGSIFFRAGSEEQKQEADRRKIRFADEWGDVVTLTNVYREWETVPDKQRNGWCLTNSINAKSMRLAKDVLRDTMQAFTQDIGIKIEAKQSDREDLNKALAKIIFDCYTSHLSLYSGHKMAGYLVAKSPTTSLNVHPSSALNYVEETPKWVVYEQVLTTGKTYLLNATPVDKEWVKEASGSGKITYCRDTLRYHLLIPHSLRGVGKTCFQRLKKYRAAELKRLEEDVKSQVMMRRNFENCGVIIDVNSEFGAIHLFVQRAGFAICVELVKDFWQKIQTELWKENIERQIASEEPSVRLLLGRGASVKDILMPNEIRQVRISGVTEEVDVLEKLKNYGRIEKVDRSASEAEIWGYVTFRTATSAAGVLKSTHLPNLFKVEAAKSHTRQAESSNARSFTLKVVATRRPHRGMAFVNFGGNVEDLYAISTRICDLKIQKRTARLPFSHSIPMHVSNKNSEELFIKNVPYWADEEVIREAIQRSSPDATGFRVTVPRTQVPSERENEQLENSLKGEITSILLLSGVQQDEFSLNLLQGSARNFTMIMLINFNDAEKAQRAARHIDGVEFNLGVLEATINLRARYFISKFVYNLIGNILNEEIDQLNDPQKGLTVNLRPARFGNWNVFVEATEVLQLASAKSHLTGLIEGQQVDMTAEELLHFSHPGASSALREIERESGAKCRIEHQRSAMFIHGKRETIGTARVRIEKFLQEAKKTPQREISLRSGELAAVGLLKALVLEFGTNLEGLHNVIAASRIELVLRQQSILVQCSDDDYTKLLDIIRAKASTLQPVKRSDSSIPDCPVCLTPVELSSTYVTECCGHYYCNDCAKNLVQNAIANNTIPIQCASEGCAAPLVLQDFRNLGVELDKICATALRVFMNKNVKSYGHCVTTDCPMIYRKWTGADEASGGASSPSMAEQLNKGATIYKCPMCNVSICTKCEVPYHAGMTCQLYAHSRGKGENLKEVGEWVAMDPKNRGFCPGCFVGIEKNGGCPHMQCTKCKIHICWGCRKTFADASSTYYHISHNCRGGDIF